MSPVAILFSTVCLCHHCCPPGHSSIGVLPLWCSRSNVERLPLGLITFKNSMNVYCICLNYCVSAFKSWNHTGTRLAVRTTSVFGSCDNLPCHRRHHARILSNWNSCHQDAAVGCPLGPSTAQEPGVNSWWQGRPHSWCCGWWWLSIRHPPQTLPPRTGQWHGRPRPEAQTSLGRDQRGAIAIATAVAIACLLGVQPGIHRLQIPSPDRPVATVLQS